MTLRKASAFGLLRCRQSNIFRQSAASSSLVIGAVAVLYFADRQKESSNCEQKNIPMQRRRRHDDRGINVMAASYSKPFQLLASMFETVCSITLCEQQPRIIVNGNDDNYHDDDDDDDDGEEESRNFHQTLRYHKSIAHIYKSKWDWMANDAKSSHIPTSSWPFNVPDETEVGSIMFDLQFCHRILRPSRKGVWGDDNEVDYKEDQVNVNDGSSKGYCQNIQFRIAMYLLAQTKDSDQRKGLKLIKDLVEHHHHPDAICSYASCLNDGRAGLEDPNPGHATKLWKIAADQFSHVQSMFELGVAYYTGEGVPEDEEMAVKYFSRAAECGNVGAAFMLGDCLLDGVGVKKDRGEALEWLVTAGELGHRGARSRVLAVLEKKDGESYGEFTDSSRQTLKESDDTDDKAKNAACNLQRKHTKYPVVLERRYTLGGRSTSNAAILARRKTNVKNSRADHRKT